MPVPGDGARPHAEGGRRGTLLLTSLRVIFVPDADDSPHLRVGAVAGAGAAPGGADAVARGTLALTLAGIGSITVGPQTPPPLPLPPFWGG
mgnify:CR=1 FL=1